MKRISLLFMLLLWGLLAQAQQMSVTSFKLLPNDKSATEEGSKRVDQNGQIAALIRIVTSERGFGFEGGALGIVDAKQQTDQVWVWIPYGARKITIKHPVFGVLRDYRFPVEIKSGCTYEMVLNIKKSAHGGSSTELTKQFLSFRVTPINATLEVEDEVWPLDEDGMAERVVDFGSYHYSVRAEGYQTDAGIAKVNNPDMATSVTVELLSTMGWIDFAVTPSSKGADIYVGREKIGQVPCLTKGLPAGNYEVELRKIGYSNLKRNVVVKEGETLKLGLDMKLENSAVFKVNGVSFTMKKVPEGTFMMGGNDRYADEDEKPVHEVSVSTFFMGETEVTQALWKAVMGDNPSEMIGDRLPVHKVAWNDCQSFIDKLNKLTGREFRMPTEAEWEYAARGGTTTNLYNGENIVVKAKYNAPNLDKLAWYAGNCGQGYTSSNGCDVSHGHSLNVTGKQYNDAVGGFHPVGTKQPNAYGLYDMLGNASEWCSDLYGPYDKTSQKNPTGPTTGTERVQRGGSWYDLAEYLRVCTRFRFGPQRWRSDSGLRLALSVEDKSYTTLGDESMRAGNYADAVQYYRLAYELSDDEALVSKIELAQRLTDEVYAVDESVKANLFDKAYTHIDNILKIDPTNTYVNTKREQIRVARAEYRSEQFRKSTKGFRGSKERHDILGGIHFEAGANFSQFKPYTEKMTMGYRGKLSYGYYKYFPIIVDVNSTVYGNYQSLGGGLGSAYMFSDRFALNYGLGWQKNWYSPNKSVVGFASEYSGTSQNLYYSLGLTYMFSFDEDYSKQRHIGLSYSFNHSLGNSEHPVYSHNLSYVFSEDMSIYLGALVALLTLGAAGYIMKQ